MREGKYEILSSGDACCRAALFLPVPPHPSARAENRHAQLGQVQFQLRASAAKQMNDLRLLAASSVLVANMCNRVQFDEEPQLSKPKTVLTISSRFRDDAVYSTSSYFEPFKKPKQNQPFYRGLRKYRK